MLQIQLDPCGKSLDACQNPAMSRLLALTLCASLACMAGCSRDTPVAGPAAAAKERSSAWLGAPRVQQTPASIGARFPHLAATADGAIVVMSWLEPVNDAGQFRLRLSQWQEGRRWAEPTEVASGKDWFVNWADFPSVMPSADGPWAAHWLQQKPGGVYSYDVMVELSDDGGRTWGEPRHLTTTARPPSMVSSRSRPWAASLTRSGSTVARRPVRAMRTAPTSMVRPPVP